MTRILPGIPTREFSRGNYFSFSAAAVHQIDSPPRSGRVTYRARQYPAGILILSYYLISSVTRTNAVPRRPFSARSANWPRYIPSMFLLPFIVVNLYPVGLALQDECARSRSRGRIPFPSLSSSDPSWGSRIRRMKYGREPFVDVRQSRTGWIEQPNGKLRSLHVIVKQIKDRNNRDIYTFLCYLK